MTYMLRGLKKRRIFLLFVISFAFVSLLSIGNAPVAEGQYGPKNYSELLSKAQAAGSVRIIARLDMPFFPEGLLSTSLEAVDQRGRISRMQNRLHESFSKYNVKGIKRYKYIPYTAMEVDSAALRALISNPLVVSIQEDIPVPPTLTDSVPLIKADQAWASGYTGLGWTVAILDTGVDKTHSFFAGGKVVAEACYSTTDAGYPSTTVCPDGSESQTGSGAGVNCDVLAIDGCEHGTHVAGIAAGKDAGINGVAKDATIIAIQVFSEFTGLICTSSGLTSPCALSYSSDQILALEHVYSLRTTYNIAAVNMSLGGGWYDSNCDSDARKAAIDTLRSAGIATVISSGNNGYCDGIGAPACISSAVSVGATTKSDAEASYSNYHPTMLPLFAPGSSITSSIPGGGWASWSGTSMAAPHVTGAWAILKQASPTASVDELLNNLKNTGVYVTSPCDGGQKPRIDVLAALPPNPPSGLSGSASSASEIVLNWTDNSLNETGFKIERKTGAGGTYGEIATASANATTYNDTGLSERTTYYYQVRASNLVADSSYSNEVSATTLLAAPSGLSASTSSASQIDLIWTDNSSLEAGFKIERKTEAGGTYSEIATVSANTTQYSNTGLNAFQTYYYRVRAYTAAENSDYSNEDSATTLKISLGGGGGCFIATAAYGTRMAREIDILQNFRDKILLASSIGKAFVNLYYTISPPIAVFIAEHDNLRSIVRLGLLPIVGLSWVSLKIGFVPTLLILVLLISSPLIFICAKRISETHS